MARRSFRDAFPLLPIGQLAVLRPDGALYSCTI
jgi:hypothetical protein